MKKELNIHMEQLSNFSLESLPDTNPDMFSEVNVLDVASVGAEEQNFKGSSACNNVLDQLLSLIQPVNLQEWLFPELIELNEQLFSLNQKLKTESGEALALIHSSIQQLSKEISSKNLTKKHVVIGVAEYIIHTANQNGLGIIINNGSTFLYNKSYWEPIELDMTKQFLVKAALKMGLDKYQTLYHKLVEELYAQFKICGVSDISIQGLNSDVSINLQNGTLDITPEGVLPLREFRKADFMKYELCFNYDPSQSAPLFEAYLNKVLPDKTAQAVLSEYLGYIFLKNGVLKLEKVLMLYGSGANGKSVMYDIVRALLGDENISSFSPQRLMNPNTGAALRAKIEHKLLNYSSESGGDIDSDMFKKMASGEPLDARPLYKPPYEMTQYSKLMFNANTLPQAPEMTEAWFRRFIIIPFNVQIPPKERDANLANKIIANELSGVFNWVLKGLERLLKSKGFTHSDFCTEVLKNYQKESDSVLLFLDEAGFVQSHDSKEDLSQRMLYIAYCQFCANDRYKAVSNKNFAVRLKSAGYSSLRYSEGFKFNIMLPTGQYDRYNMRDKPVICGKCGNSHFGLNCNGKRV